MVNRFTGGAMRVDVHQHLWPAAVLEALARRATAPRLVDEVLHPLTEPCFALGEAGRRDAADGGAARAEQARADRLDLVALSPSPALGIESLPGEQAQELLTVWLDSATALGEPFRVWAACPVLEPDPVQVGRDLARPGVCGLQLPAPALATPGAVERLGPVLAAAEAANAPVLVHPGPAAAVDGGAAPSWWGPVVGYVAQQYAAWHAWQVAGTAAHPDLRIAFVALAGLAPLHHERRRARGGPQAASVSDPAPRVYYETSSYGPAAVQAMAGVAGPRTLVHGSDRPNALPSNGFGSADLDDLVLTVNPLRLLEGDA